MLRSAGLGASAQRPGEPHGDNHMPSDHRVTRTKIVATLGPASESTAQLRALIDAGVDVFRLNMSHMSLDAADEVIARIRRLSQRVAVLIDLQGPKVRLTDVDEPFELRSGSRIRFRAASEVTSQEQLCTPESALVRALEPGHRLLIDDGRIVLRCAERLDPGAVTAEVVTGGLVKGRKGIAAPDARFAPDAYLDEQDELTLRFGVKRQIDFVAASYVSRAADIDTVRAVLGEAAGEIGIVAKVESRVGVENIDEIIEAADGVMVARGDLGVEIPPEEVPLIQKLIIRKCNYAAKPVIVATQMLDSMVSSPVASRAETSDVANAILDGTDAVMLSAETSIGQHPVQAVRTLERISKHIEAHGALFREDLFRRPANDPAEFICKNAARAAKELGCKAIVAFTNSGFTARNVAAFRPGAAIIATSPDDSVVRRLSLHFGVYGVQAEHIGRYDVMLYRNLDKLIRKKLLTPDDLIAVIGGVPVGKPGSTNMLQVATVRELMDAE